MRPVTDPRRVRILRDGPRAAGPVVYWMQRDQRAADNWALIHAQELARERGVPLGVVFCLVPRFLGAPRRAYDFMLAGLRETEERLRRLAIPFHLLIGEPPRVLPRFARAHGVGLVVTDFLPLRIVRAWQAGVVERLRVPLHQVDAHNIVPCWEASDKLEYAARTIRPKIRAQLGRYLVEFPSLTRHPRPWIGTAAVDWDAAHRALRAPRRATAESGIAPGAAAARRTLRRFIRTRLARYAVERNDPNRAAQSGLSPYLHFGQIAAQRVALEIVRAGGPRAARDAFLEELIVRRELSDNFCHYEPDYDLLAGLPAWGRRTLAEHGRDARPRIYTASQLLRGATHDPLWNAAQRGLVATGGMPGYLRMYWAKKILEWTAQPEEALAIAIHLNDAYQLDGRDPNGYAGIAWCIGGRHDRPWFDRPIFGQVRFMSLEGCRRKFDVEAYVARGGARRRSEAG
jgi:deoxyribodipyrimidine photo-lyase